MKTVGLFAGIGGIELGLKRAGHESLLLCEIEPTALAVLRKQFPDAELHSDIRKLKALPKGTDIVAAGFPCQDLSQAGRTAGIKGNQSGLVTEVFRLIESASKKPTWLIVENVSFMLSLDAGKAMSYLTGSIEKLGYTWAYRTVDSRSFGLPQRRQRVILVASQTEDPRSVIFADETVAPEPIESPSVFGFYWTEGTKGLGWAEDSVPTLKGGSTVGIPSPPAIWIPGSNEVVTPEIRDAERLQGFPVNWTLPALTVPGSRKGARWKLVGNAVSVPVAKWIGERILSPGKVPPNTERYAIDRDSSWPKAGWGHAGRAFKVDISMWPLSTNHPKISDFLKYPPVPLSLRATTGFLKRARNSSLRFKDGFLEGLESHIGSIEKGPKP